MKMKFPEGTGISSQFYSDPVSLKEFNEVVAWSKAGLLTISGEDIQTLAEQQQALPIVGFVCGPFVTKRIVVTPTQSGIQLDKGTRVLGTRDARFIYAQFVTMEVAEIVANNEIRKNVDRLRVVNGIVQFHYSDVGKRVRSFEGYGTPEKRKIAALLKFDVFDKKWKIVTHDSANLNEDLQTPNVTNYLLMHYGP